ncbi:MAG TPA: M20/M25/M40 family metallo-hydrolase [Pyrinomonadaceae bacterium]
MYRRSISFVLLLVVTFSGLAIGRDRIDDRVLAQIKAEGFQNSKAMDTVGYLTDVFGHRLTHSENLKKAKAWMMSKMTEFGLENVRAEPWGNWGQGWNLERFSVEMTAPTYERLHAYPLAWTPSTNGIVSGEPISVSIRSKDDFEKYRGKLKGAIVMNGRVTFPTPESRAGDPFKRLTDEELRKKAAVIDPAKDPDGGGTTTYHDEEKDWLEALKRGKEVTQFLKSEGVAAVINPSSRPNGVLAVQGSYFPDPAINPPTFVLAREQFARIARLLERKIPVKVELGLQTKSDPDGTGSNVIGEIPGSDPKLKAEVVMLGGHFDSWHSGTGAADNAASCVALVEALRILKAVGLKPRRTIRVVLWDGEEQDYYGSIGYVTKHYGDPFTINIKPAHSNLSAYYNLDNGAGRIRGIYLQGNEESRRIFQEFLGPFAYLGASTITTLNTGGTDHMSFDSIGLPGFQFIQDPLDYNTRVHHTNMDVLEAVVEEDLKVNAVIVAAVAYQTAMMNEKMPRKELPKPAEGDWYLPQNRP